MAEQNKYASKVEELRRMKELKEQKNEDLKALNAAIELLERQILDEMEQDGIDKLSIKGVGTASMKIEDYPQVKDMEALLNWCYENNRAGMIQKRISKQEFDSYYAETNSYPDGVDTYTKRTLSFRRT